jgi:hypothetical protein
MNWGIISVFLFSELQDMNFTSLQIVILSAKSLIRGRSILCQTRKREH